MQSKSTTKPEMGGLVDGWMGGSFWFVDIYMYRKLVPFAPFALYVFAIAHI